ncbi:MAG: restriction endonuclease subunit S [Actinobacteria bacterium]|nr:restriction endonuclease subunit S [Actinomycetota bacterium]
MTTYVRLGDVTTKIGSGATPRGGQAVYRQQGTAFIRSQNVLDNSMKLDDIARISDEAADQLRGVEVREGDVLLNITGDSIARVCLVDTDVLPARVSQHVAIIRTTPEMDAGFLQRWLVYEPTKAALLAMSDGGTRKALTKAHIQGLDVPCPPIDVQRGIAEVLGALDDKIAANARLGTAVDDMVRALFVEATSGAEIGSLSEIAEVNQVSVKPGIGDLRYLDIASVSAGTYESPAKSPWASAPGRARRKIRRGDTLWSTVRPNRRSHALILEDDPLLVGSTGLAVLTPKDGRFAFLFEASRTDAFRAYLESVAEGSAYPAVRGERFLQAPVPLPDDEFIDQFEATAAPLRERAASAHAESATLAATRDALLPLLMSGKVTVKAAESTVGEVL